MCLMVRFRSVAVVVTLGIVTGCGETVTTPPDGGFRGDPGSGGGGGGGISEPVVDIHIGGASFQSSRFVDPNEALMEISRGVTVRWIAASDIPHTVTPLNHTQFPRAQSTTRGKVVLEHTFWEPGRYDYYCEFHRDAGMRGAIRVYSLTSSNGQ